MANTKVTSRVLADDAVLTANITDANVTTAKIAADAITTAKIADDVALGGNPTSTTQSAGNNTTRLATTAFVTTAISNLADSAPAALDTLNELAAAIGDDANFSTTVTNSIATKLPLAGGTMTGDLILGDNIKIELGSASGGDLQIYHDGSNSYVSDQGTGQLVLLTNSFRVNNAANSENIITAEENGAVSLFYNDAVKLATVTGGVTVTGTLTAGDGHTFGSDGDDNLLIASSANENIVIDSADDIILDADGGDIIFKDGGTAIAQFWNANSGDFYIGSQVSNKDFYIRGNDNGSGVNAVMFDMSEAGTATFNHDIKLGDNGQALFGAGDDLTIYHDGSDSYIKDTGSGNLLIQYSDLYFSKDAGSSHSVVFRSTGRVGIGTTGPSHMLHVSAADGESDNTQAMTIENNEATDGRSYGLKIKAGSTANDASLFVQDHDASNDHFIIRGNGNVGIGTTAPAETLHIKRADGTALIVESSNDQNNTGDRINIEFRTDAAQGIAKIIGGKEGNYQGSSTRSGYLAFQTINANSYAERMRIDSVGRVLINNTIPNPVNIASHKVVVELDSSTSGIAVGADGLVDTRSVMTFYNDNGVTGSITTNGESTAFNTSSDYRLKENVDYTWDATTRLKQLKPARFNFKTDTDTTVDGFLAHEVQNIVPEAITGEKDGTEMQGIDQSKLVPLLVKAIQEQQTIIDDLKSRIETLEG